MSRPKRSKQAPTPSSNTTDNHHSPLLPGLPDHLSILPLSSLSPTLLFSVCHSWRRLLFSPSFPSPHLSLFLTLTSSTTTKSSSLLFTSFDPITSTWSPLPPPPLPHPILLHHPSFLSRPFPLQSCSTSSSLLLISATASPLVPLLSRPLIFHPSLSKWLPGPSFTSPRRWCALGSDNLNRIFLASGVGTVYSADVARSFEMWDTNSTHGWISLEPLRDGRFSREATDMVHSNGKLCMVSLKGKGLKEGAVYDLESHRWTEMPTGMLEGWNGSVAAVDGVLYGVEEDDSVLRRYDLEEDEWRVVMEDGRLRGAVAISGACGKVCVACGGGRVVLVVDARDGTGVWTVVPPDGGCVIGMHVLPRIGRRV